MNWWMLLVFFGGSAAGFLAACLMSRADEPGPDQWLEARYLIEDACDEGGASDPAWRARAVRWLEEGP